MISTSSLIAIVFTLFVVAVLPILALLIFCIKNKSLIMAVALGAAAFIFPQLVVRIPLLQMLQTMPMVQNFIEHNIVPYIFMLGFSAGLFELVGRVFVLYVLRKQLSYKTALAVGLGHGAIESIMLLGNVYLNNLLLSIMINTGTAQSAGVTQETIDLLVNTPVQSYLLAGVERLAVIIIQIGFTMLVAVGFAKGRVVITALICLLLHGLLDSFAVLINNMTGNPLFSIIYVACFASAGLMFTIFMRPMFNDSNGTETPTEEKVK